MAIEVGNIVFNIGASLKKFKKALDDARKDAGGLAGAFKLTGKAIAATWKQIGIAATAAIGAITVLTKKSIDAASDLEESNNKLLVTFQGIEEQATAVRDTLVEAYGLSTTEANQLLGATGDLLTGFGFAREEALSLSQQVQELSVDLASFQNLEGGAKQASDALTKALLGETESAKSLGIVIRQNDVNARLAAEGLKGLTGQAKLQAEAQIRLKIAVEQSKNAIGDFARTSDSYANVSRVLSSRLQDLQADAGKKLLEPMADLKQAFIDATKEGGFLKDGIEGITDIAKAAITWIGELVAVINENRRVQKQANLEQEAGLDNANFLIDTTKENIKQLTALRDIQKSQNKSAEQIADTEKRIADEQAKLVGLADQQETAIDKVTAARDRGLTSIDDLNKALEDEANARNKVGKAIENETKKQELSQKQKDQNAKDRASFLKDLNKRETEFLLNETAVIQQEFFDREQSIEKSLNRGIVTQEEANRARELNAKTTEQKITDIQKAAQEERNQNAIANAQAILSTVGGFLGQLSSIVGQQTSIATQNVDNALNRQLAAIDAATEAQLEADGVIEQTEAEKAAAELVALEAQLEATNSAKKRAELQTLVDEKRSEATRLKALENAEKEKARLVDAAEKEKRKLQREGAKTQKDLAIAETLINIPTAAYAAYKALAGIPFVGPALGAIAAAAATALGFKQVQLIKDTPLPALADGGVVPSTPGGTQAIIGEGRDAEAVLPLNDEVFNNIAAGIASSLPPDAAGGTIGGAEDERTLNLTIELPSEIFFASVQAGIEDRNIRVRTSDLQKV